MEVWIFWKTFQLIDEVGDESGAQNRVQKSRDRERKFHSLDDESLRQLHLRRPPTARVGNGLQSRVTAFCLRWWAAKFVSSAFTTHPIQLSMTTASALLHVLMILDLHLQICWYRTDLAQQLHQIKSAKAKKLRTRLLTQLRVTWHQIVLQILHALHVNRKCLLLVTVDVSYVQILQLLQSWISCHL